jgi:hypothetical protein
MFSPFVYIFSILLVKIRYSVVPYLTDKRVEVGRTVVEKLFVYVKDPVGAQLKKADKRILNYYNFGIVAHSHRRG